MRTKPPANGVGYAYDGDGLRVEKSSGTLYWRAYTGQVLETTNTSGTMIRDYIFFDGRRIAWRDSSGYIHYYFVDVLGSTRAVTDSSGNVCFSADYYPYGQEATPAGVTNSCSPTYEFAGYEFDSETGNYYAYARYYDPQLGRFLSPDASASDVGSPQTLNGYAYVVNNPTTSAGPLEFPAVYLSSSGATGPGSAASIVAAITQGLPESVAAFAPPTQPSATPRSVPAHPLQEWLRIARHDEAEVRAFLTYLRSHAAGVIDPYGSGLSQMCQAFASLGIGRSLQGPGCSLYVPMGQTAQGVLVAADFNPSGSGSPKAIFLGFSPDLESQFSLYHYSIYPGSSSLPGIASINGSLSLWLDPGFPTFDMKIFFGVAGVGGGAGSAVCLPSPWDIDPCSL